jgi:Cof subfamily protein (haloacid dehalogenase superfamily)
MMRKPPRIDLIALDLDGTLLDERDGVSRANRAAIRGALDLGVRVVLVTGRGADAPERLVRELKLNLPAICAHGALTRDFLAGRTLGHIPVPLPLARPLIEHAETHKLNVAVYFEERFLSLAGTTVYMEDQRGKHWAEVPSLLEAVHSAPTFIRFLGDHAVESVRAAFPDLPLHFKYETWGDFYELAITNRDATKERALQQLCADFQVPAERVLALGDSRNDVPMLQWAGIGLAMANALPEVRQAVGRTTASCADDGVARAIEKYVLEPQKLELQKKVKSA